jgi:hypothetical protein
LILVKIIAAKVIIIFSVAKLFSFLSTNFKKNNDFGLYFLLCPIFYNAFGMLSFRNARPPPRSRRIAANERFGATAAGRADLKGSTEIPPIRHPDIFTIQ